MTLWPIYHDYTLYSCPTNVNRQHNAVSATVPYAYIYVY